MKIVRMALPVLLVIALGACGPKKGQPGDVTITPGPRVGQCKDGTTTTATGRGACSHHGGLK